MVKRLSSCTGCQVVALRDVGFSWTEIQTQLNLKIKIQCTYAYKRYLKNKFRGAKSERKAHEIVKKILSFFLRNAAKKSVRRKASVFNQNGVSICSISPFLTDCLFTDETRVTEIFEFFEEMGKIS